MKDYAFPSPVDPKTGVSQLGMTLHDYIAIQALQGMLSNPALFDTNGEFSEDNIKVAFEIADVAISHRRVA
jgi:hypothetical protein